MYPVRDRAFTPNELERLRLLLSTFRDGSGQYLKKIDGFMPDYLAFERATAMICGGTTTENKGIFDVIVPAEAARLPFGISCKMATAQRLERSAWFMELSNSAKKFHDAFGAAGIDWRHEPELAGPLLIDVVEGWHHAVDATVDVDRSKYLILQHDKTWQNFEIAALDLDLRRFDPGTAVEWTCEGRNPAKPSSVAGYVHGSTGRHRLWQFFAETGGQLKYYPLAAWMDWVTPTFQLERPPVRDLREKVEEYWPGRWPDDGPRPAA